MIHDTTIENGKRTMAPAALSSCNCRINQTHTAIFIGSPVAPTCFAARDIFLLPFSPPFLSFFLFSFFFSLRCTRRFLSRRRRGSQKRRFQTRESIRSCNGGTCVGLNVYVTRLHSRSRGSSSSCSARANIAVENPWLVSLSCLYVSRYQISQLFEREKIAGMSLAEPCAPILVRFYLYDAKNNRRVETTDDANVRGEDLQSERGIHNVFVNWTLRASRQLREVLKIEINYSVACNV